MPPAELIGTHEAARILSVHPSTIRNYVRDGVLKAVQPGPRKFLRFRVEDVRALLEPK